MSAEGHSGLRVARGAVLQVHPADREQRLSLPARQAAEVAVRVRNIGTEPLSLVASSSVPFAAPEPAELRLGPGEQSAIRYVIPPLTLEPGPASFTAILRCDHLLEPVQEARVELEVTEPVSLLVRPRDPAPVRVPAWETARIDLEVRRSDGKPCTVASLSADPWPHWLLRTEIRPEGEVCRVRLLAQAPGRRPERSVELFFEPADPGIERAAFLLKVERQSGPILVWDADGDDPLTAEKVARDDREWAEQGLTLPDVLPGDTATASFRIGNVGDTPAKVRVSVEAADKNRRWLFAGAGPDLEPARVQEWELLPGGRSTVRLALEPPLPADRWEKDPAGRIRRARTPARDLVWPGALVRIEAEGAPLVLTRRVTGSVLGALQPVPLANRILPAAIDLGLSLVAAALVYITGWALLGDYGLARLAEPLMAALGARWYSLAGGAALLLWFLLYALLLAGCQAVYRTTPGHAYAGMELRRPDGARAPVWRCAARGLLQAALLPVVCWAAVLNNSRANPLDRLLGLRVVRVVSLWEE